jgi:bifunctional DNA-binding transcriptional regulator/antitoxin component of YhaV-PrlF toxin-antitoxin module
MLPVKVLLMKTTSKCQVTLPLHQRKVAGILPRQEVETFVIVHAGRPVIAIAPARPQGKGSAMAAKWTDSLKGRGSTDSILRELRGQG